MIILEKEYLFEWTYYVNKYSLTKTNGWTIFSHFFYTRKI